MVKSSRVRAHAYECRVCFAVLCSEDAFWDICMGGAWVQCNFYYWE